MNTNDFIAMFSIGKNKDVVVDGNKLKNKLLKEAEQERLIEEKNKIIETKEKEMNLLLAKIENLYNREEELLALNLEQHNRIKDLKKVLTNKSVTIEKCLKKTQKYDHVKKSLEIQTAINEYRKMADCDILRVEL